MREKMTIKINRCSQAGSLLWLIIVLPFLFASLCELMKLPWAIRYVLDIAWIALLVLLRMHNKGKKTGLLFVWVLLFCIYTAVTYLVQYQSALYFLWGLRNNVRFFVAFFAFTTFLKPNDIRGCFKMFDVLFWINVVISLYQYFVLELSGDYLGGIFGTEKGANAYTNVFFLIMLVKDILFYLEKRQKPIPCILKCVAMLLVTALAELKFFFVEFILVLCFAVVFTKFTWRKILIILGGSAAVVLFASLLVTVFPEFEGFLSLERILEVTTSDKGYTSTGDLNRLNAISRINELWLKTPWQRLFGLGLGNCDTSSFNFLNTPFYEAYGTMHYTWISYAMMYLECGWIGLIFYFGFFVLVYLSIRRIEKRCSGVATTYCRMGRILALMCIIIAIYDSSLRTEAGYMTYFALSVPFVMRRDQIGAARRGEKK